MSKAEDENNNVNCDYNSWYLRLSEVKRQNYINLFKSIKKSDWMTSYLFEDDKYEFIYGEAADSPYSQLIMRTEENRRKLIKFLRHFKNCLRKRYK
ncbi:14448_t:CDS:2 [Funneliformis mosseae]|uniref:14448_t:CDS:1 n=1 Tax=Funneliformis mosseae TaxID=27381 RepID=A0A9N9BRA9_FUNMO|nr:14448_t:CDS:2 [Funneliformis mosseae]